MQRIAFILTFAVVLTCRSAPTAVAPFDEADNLSMSRQMSRVRELYISAAATDPDPVRRDRAAIRAANLDWHVFHDSAAARTRLASIHPDSPEISHAWAERSLLETELASDYNSARVAAAHAIETAQTSTDRAGGLTRAAGATVAQATAARLHGICADDAAALAVAITNLHDAIEAGGPRIEPARLLLDAALIAGDGNSALQAWRWYYADQPSGVVQAGTELAALLPQWKPGAELSSANRRTIALALAGSRLFPESDLMLRDPCAKARLSEDRDTHDVIVYAAVLRRLSAISSEHYRLMASASGRGHLDKDVINESMVLWEQLSWPDKVPAFSLKALNEELARRFGTVATLGDTEGIPTLLLGHRVIDETRDVAQYGRKASLRFIELDGMLSSGYAAWLTRDDRGTGGWATDDVIYQIRPMYADGPVIRWRGITDDGVRKENEKKIGEESQRDLERARVQPITYLPGLQGRLNQQATLAIRDRLAATGLSGDALRDAVIGQLSRDKFDSSIWAHEGRHAIDKKIFGIRDATDLEYRAKLSEIALAPSPRLMGSVLDPIGGSSPHGKANERALTGVVAWMRAHAAEISGLDPKLPLLPQLDCLTDDQIRAAFRSLDPLANKR